MERGRKGIERRDGGRDCHTTTQIFHTHKSPHTQKSYFEFDYYNHCPHVPSEGNG